MRGGLRPCSARVLQSKVYSRPPASEPLSRLHQPQIEQLPGVPFERDRVVPVEALDIEGRAGVALERLGGAERHDGGREVVVPRAGIGVVFFVRKGVIVAQAQALFGAEQRDTVDLAPGGGGVFLVAPAQPAEEIERASA